MALNFNQFAIEANTFLKKYSKELELGDNTDQAGRILSSILHGLRETISPEESLQLIAQFPMFLKAVYVNGWTAHRRDKVKTMDEFIELVRDFNGVTAWHDFETDELAVEYFHKTFKMLRVYISMGELKDIRSEMPKSLKSLIYTEKIV